MKSQKKLSLISVLASLMLILSGSSLAMCSCSKLDADDPKYTNPGDTGNKDEDKDKPSADDPSTDDPATDDPAVDEPGKDDPETPDTPEDPNEKEDTFNPNDLYYVRIPDDIPSQTKHYTGFYVSFNKDNHTPNYVSWELLKSEVGGSVARTDNFWQDKSITGCPDGNAYKGSGYDRGHMCPAADQKWSTTAMNDCFVMANMCPQAPGLNQKAWQTLEDKERNWAIRDGAIWIICGPIYEPTDTQTIGSYKVRVPSSFFKAFLYLDGDNSRAIAFVYPNAVAPGNMEEYAMSIDDLEKITNYDFFYALPDDIENKVEATYSFTYWNKSK